MKRIVDQHLQEWKVSKHRKPLMIRGARQVGKTSAVRYLAESFPQYLEINFEAQSKWKDLFEGDLNPQQILMNLELMTGQKIIQGETLLFLDEIQICPRAILALRYFYEKRPELHVIAAGSLLEFAIEEVGIPVGRVQFLYMYPMSFIEFLWALDQERLVEAFLSASVHHPLNELVHDKLNQLLGEYLAIGGMPEAVAHWVSEHNYKGCVDIHHDLLSAFKQDFQKYAKTTQIKFVEQLFQYVPQQLGQVFKYQRIPGDFRKRELAPALSLLIKANIVIPVYLTSAQGFPLGAQANLDKFKLIFLDVALTQVLLGLTSSAWMLDSQISFVNKGMIAEAFVGQEMLVYAQPRQSKSLYYWHREQPSSQAEVDYLLAHEQKIIPIEVKSGKGSTLRSMHSFLNEHSETEYGVRFSLQNYSVFEKIYTYPLYSVAKLLLSSL